MVARATAFPVTSTTGTSILCFKAIIANMGAGLHTLVERFDHQLGVPVGTSAHSVKSGKSDVESVVSVLHTVDVFRVQPGRKHSRFRKVYLNPLKTLK